MSNIIVDVTSIRFREANRKDKANSTKDQTVFLNEKYYQIFVACSKPLDNSSRENDIVSEYGIAFDDVTFFVELDAFNHIKKKASLATFPCTSKLIINRVPRFGKFQDELVDIDFNVDIKKVA